VQRRRAGDERGKLAKAKGNIHGNSLKKKSQSGFQRR
jgi:hypothetical protein